MTRHHGFVRSIAIAAACTVGLVLGVGAADPPNFKPDGAFKGSALTGLARRRRRRLDRAERRDRRQGQARHQRWLARSWTRASRTCSCI